VCSKLPHSRVAGPTRLAGDAECDEWTIDDRA
jgi:hypothetical protein